MNSASGHPLRHRARGGQVNCFTIPTARSGSTEFACGLTFDDRHARDAAQSHRSTAVPATTLAPTVCPAPLRVRSRNAGCSFTATPLLGSDHSAARGSTPIIRPLLPYRAVPRVRVRSCTPPGARGHRYAPPSAARSADAGSPMRGERNAPVMGDRIWRGPEWFFGCAGRAPDAELQEDAGAGDAKKTNEERDEAVTI